MVHAGAKESGDRVFDHADELMAIDAAGSLH